MVNIMRYALCSIVLTVFSTNGTEIGFFPFDNMKENQMIHFDNDYCGKRTLKWEKSITSTFTNEFGNMC